MCLIYHYHSLACGHHYLAVIQPCWPGLGFNYCGRISDGVARERAPEYEIADYCIGCKFPNGMYDHNQFRMVVAIHNRCRWGFGPSRNDPGLECTCM